METRKPTTKSATFFISTVAVTRTQEDGEKRVKEQYAIDAASFTEAEAKTFEQLSGTDLEIKDISIAPFKEAFLADGDKFYRVKVNFITINENNGKEKKQSVCYLAQASSTSQAQKVTEAVLSGTMQDYSVEAVIETKILEVFCE